MKRPGLLLEKNSSRRGGALLYVIALHFCKLETVPSGIRTKNHLDRKQQFRIKRLLDPSGLSTANISLQTNEMSPAGLEKPQLPHCFAVGDRTPETAENLKIGLLPASVSFHPNLRCNGAVSRNDVNPRFSGFPYTELFVPYPGRRAGTQLGVHQRQTPEPSRSVISL